MHKRWLFVALQSAVTVALLAFFFHDAEFRRQALDAFRHAHPGWLVAGVLIAGAENMIGAARWRIFLRMLEIEVPFWKAVQVCLVALFCNTFLLGAAGGDLVRAAYLIRRGAGKTHAFLSVILDRVSGLAALIAYTAGLAAMNYEWLMRSPKVALMLKFVIAYQVGCALLILGALYVSVRGLTNHLPRWAPFPEFVRKMGAGYARMYFQWGKSLGAAGLSFVMLAAYFAVFFCSARAFGLNISFLHLATIMPMADMISALPISIGGMGVREQVFVFLLGQLTASPTAQAVSISLVGYFLNISWGIVGAAILPLYKGLVREARTASPTAE
jgi:uncharacterized protein (TIRG00374 family)